DATIMQIKTQLSSFDFEEYKIDEAEAEFDVDLGKNRFVFKKIKGLKGRSKLSADGELNFETLDLGMEVRHSSLYYDDMRAIYYPLQKDLTWLPDKFLGELKATITLGGKVDLDKLKVFGKMSGKNLYAYNES